MLSVVSRNSVVGIGGPIVIALALQVVTLISLPAWGQMALLSTPFLAWHGFWAQPAFYGPFRGGLVTSAAWFVVCAAVSWLVFRAPHDRGGVMTRRARARPPGLGRRRWPAVRCWPWPSAGCGVDRT